MDYYFEYLIIIDLIEQSTYCALDVSCFIKLSDASKSSYMKYFSMKDETYFRTILVMIAYPLCNHESAMRLLHEAMSKYDIQ